MPPRLVETGAIAIVGGLLGAALLAGLAPLTPPTPLPADAPIAAFSAARAAEHVETIAAMPHPVGSDRQLVVGTYILSRLTATGLQGAVQASEATVTPRGAAPRTVAVRNIVATIPGTRPTKAVVLAAHYDSTPRSPGASDNGAGVATLLETARALTASPRLANDVTLLFTDGEEAGLLGARAFVNQDAMVSQAGALLNFDARGRTGPVVMFETAGASLPLVAILAGSMPRPVATSFSEDVYRRMPNRTDFTVFKRRGLRGMNFAFFGEPAYYHSPTDAIATLDRATLQHQGTYALALTRALGNRTLPLAGQARAVYFNLGTSLVYYPDAWTWPLAILLVVLALAILIRARSLQVVTIRTVALATVLVLALIVVSIGIGFAADRWLAAAFHARDGSPGPAALYFTIVSAVVAGAVLVLAWAARRLVGRVALLVAVHAWWIVLALTLTAVAPGASYLFVWPALAGLLVQVPVVMTRSGASAPGLVMRLGLTVPAIIAVLLCTPATGLTYAAVGAVVTPVVALLVALTLAFLVPAWRMSAPPEPQRVDTRFPAPVPTAREGAASSLARHS